MGRGEQGGSKKAPYAEDSESGGEPSTIELLRMSASIGIWPERFWKMTPFELSTCFTGAERRFEQQRTLAAWHACNIMNVWMAAVILSN